MDITTFVAIDSVATASMVWAFAFVMWAFLKYGGKK